MIQPGCLVRGLLDAGWRLRGDQLSSDRLHEAQELLVYHPHLFVVGLGIPYPGSIGVCIEVSSDDTLGVWVFRTHSLQC